VNGNCANSTLKSRKYNRVHWLALRAEVSEVLRELWLALRAEVSEVLRELFADAEAGT
jgi:hypothetical protein